ncbi:hypothetical protein K461DRAFT_226833 [Myriangium duriaei CBS 260.36]|uniref:Major facilitator superfamily transporter n=1 Tax=Myriangium duriaei CBS 260.36 TaxID=1168546 RepID=A0A9P4MG02_9PEZI|nr:hypothetical protein K461DRAFT_226833 [Myriangium duriaei CBS 260.36]
MADRLRSLNPLNLISNGSGFFYQNIPGASPHNGAPSRYRWPSPRRTTERLFPARFSPTRMVWMIISALFVLFLLIGGYHHREVGRRKAADSKPEPFPWQLYQRLNGYYNGIRNLVPYSDYTPDNGYNKTLPRSFVPEAQPFEKMPPLNPQVFDPYPKYDSPEYLSNHAKVEKCTLDSEGKISAPEVFVYPGVPQNMSEPFFGSYSMLGLEEKVCFDRYSRFAPYGYGASLADGGLGPGNNSENIGSERVTYQMGKVIDYKTVDWGTAQDECYAKNKPRFEQSKNLKIERVKRHAYVLRVWQGFYFNEHIMYTLRAMINELSLKSGGEYDVHFLLHVKNTSAAIWANHDVYAQVVRESMPQEFWNMTTLWSEPQLENYYPDPFGDAFENVSGGSIHGVYRSAHFPLQWFAQQHKDYDFYWNWEMDLRFTGHYYEFNTAIGEWAKKQPRKGLWERNERFYIPKRHGSWQNFTDTVEQETKESGRKPIWGPEAFPGSEYIQAPPETQPKVSYDQDNFEWGVGEDADYLSFNPIFDPTRSNWVFRNDITGYDLTKPQPPTRCAIITVARLSKRLLNIMHEEVWKSRHSMFAEMWPPSVALHYGLKAVYVPHPIYFDRDWDLTYMDQIFNHPTDIYGSPFGWGEHNLLGSSFYYNSGFSGALWRRWLGQAENHEGGRKSEEEGSGRMCLRSMLHHPIKHESGPMD